MMDSIHVFRSFPRDSNDKGNVDVDQNMINVDQNVVNVNQNMVNMDQNMVNVDQNMVNKGQNVVNVRPKYGQHGPNVLNMENVLK